MTQQATLSPAGTASTTVDHFGAGRPLGRADEHDLQADLAVLLPDLRIPELFAARPELLAECEDLFVARDAAGNALSVLGTTWKNLPDGREFLHIGVQFTGVSARGGQAFSESWLALLTGFVAQGKFPRLSALKTYNPVAFCAMRAYGLLVGAAMFPAVEARVQDPSLVSTGAAMAGVLAPGARYDEQTGRLHAVGVPVDLYRSVPTSADAAANSYFAAHTQPGDRILCIVDIASAETERMIVEQFTARARREDR